jgi:S-adenosyl methyltransferase
VSSQNARRIDTSVAHPARRYNYWIGGKDHFAADRESADAITAMFPSAPAAARENRAFLQRAVTFLVREAGVRQFLDIGTGIPAPGNTHEVAQAHAKDSRVVYVDNDPIVLSHGRALLNSTPEGASGYIEADLRDYPKIFEHPDFDRILDLSQPVALLLVAVLHFLQDEEDPYAIVSGLVEALPAGSFLVISHGTADYASTETRARICAAIKHGAIYPRGRSEFGRFFEGLELVAPGIVPVPDWQPEDGPDPRLTPIEAATYAAVGRVPDRG